MKYISLLALISIAAMALLSGCAAGPVTSAEAANDKLPLPPPQKDSETSIEEALLGRQSVRDFTGTTVSLQQLSQLCWAAQGVTHGTGRTAPSAGGLYPLRVYAVVGNVENLTAGVYLYDPVTHTFNRLIEGDLRESLSKAALSQRSVKQAPVDFVITGNYGVVTPRYSDRAERYTHLEAGHASQNICLQAVGLNLGVVTIGAFDDDAVRKVLKLSEDETPLYIIPAGNY